MGTKVRIVQILQNQIKLGLWVCLPALWWQIQIISDVVLYSFPLQL